MDDLSLILTLAERHPYLAAVAAVVCALGVAVVALAQVYPSEDWCRAHPRLFAVLRLCRAVAPWLLKAADRLREARSTPLAQAAIARAFDKAAPASAAPAVDRQTEPPTDAPDTDPTPPASLGGNARRTLPTLSPPLPDATAAPAWVPRWRRRFVRTETSPWPTFASSTQ
jgi:hypothetical protein